MTRQPPLRRAPLRIAATVLLVGLASCDSDPPVPLGPGQLDGLLVSPHGAEGAVVFQLSGLGIGAIAVDDGTAFVETDGSTTRMVIVLDDPGAVKFRMYVAERSEPPEFTVVEVADGDNQLRSQLSGYSVVLTPVIDTLASLRRVAR